MSSATPLAQIVPWLPLGEVLLFPQASLSLRIFEDTHKLMLEDALKGMRMLAVSGYPPDALCYQDAIDRTHLEGSLMTLGLISSCRRTTHDTSEIILKGLMRVQCNALVTENPYPIVRIQKLCSDRKPARATLGRLTRELLALLADGHDLEGSKELLLHLKDLSSPEAIIDAVAAALCPQLTCQQDLLQTVTPEKRLSILIEDLRQAQASVLIEQALRGELNKDHICSN